MCDERVIPTDAVNSRYFLDYVHRSEGFDSNARAAAYVTPEWVERFLAELSARVSSVTGYGSIYKLRRAAQLLAPGQDFTWLTEIEKDLAFLMQPRSKFGRLVSTEVLVEAGMTLMAEADRATHRSALTRARQFRNGLKPEPGHKIYPYLLRGIVPPSTYPLASINPSPSGRCLG